MDRCNSTYLRGFDKSGFDNPEAWIISLYGPTPCINTSLSHPAFPNTCCEFFFYPSHLSLCEEVNTMLVIWGIIYQTCGEIAQWLEALTPLPKGPRFDSEHHNHL